MNENTKQPLNKDREFLAYITTADTDDSIDFVKEDMQRELSCACHLYELKALGEIKRSNELGELWKFEYDTGYFKALLDIKNMIEDWHYEPSLRTKKKYQRAIESYLKLLTEDSWVREKFMEYGGEPDWRELGVIMTKDGEVKRDTKRVLSES